jgi:hypothetical protein
LETAAMRGGACRPQMHTFLGLPILLRDVA